jgi:hypothetical protein
MSARKRKQIPFLNATDKRSRNADGSFKPSKKPARYSGRGLDYMVRRYGGN